LKRGSKLVGIEKGDKKIWKPQLQENKEPVSFTVTNNDKVLKSPPGGIVGVLFFSGT